MITSGCHPINLMETQEHKATIRFDHDSVRARLSFGCFPIDMSRSGRETRCQGLFGQLPVGRQTSGWRYRAINNRFHCTSTDERPCFLQLASEPPITDLFYSFLSACIGSTDAARRAGSHAAIDEQMKSKMIVPLMTRESSGFTS